MPSSGFGKSLRNKETDRPPFRVNIKNELQPQTGVEPGELREIDVHLPNAQHGNDDDPATHPFRQRRATRDVR